MNDSNENRKGKTSFFNADESMYERAYSILSHQREKLNSISNELAEISKTNQSKNLSKLQSMAMSLLNSDYGSLYLCASTYSESIQDILQNNHPTEQESSLSNRLLNVCLRVSRIFSCVCSPLPQENKIKHENSSQNLNTDNTKPTEQEEEVVLCRICEEYVPVSMLAEHNQSCLRAYESEFDMITTDQKIRKLLRTIMKTVLHEKWPGEKNRSISSIIPMLHLLTILESAISTEPCPIDNITQELNHIKVSQTETPILMRAKMLVSEKARAIETFEEASVILRQTRVSGNLFGASSLQTTIADFRFIKRISSGAYAKVYLAEKTRTKDTYAIKVTPKNTLKQKNDFERAITEKDILLRNSNPFIVAFYYSIIGTHNLYLVMDFVPGGDLYSLLQKFGCFDEDSARIYTAQIVKALEYLHANGVIHRDIKPDNILITSSGKLKLTDFGLSIFGAFDRGNREVVGTPGYMAPEIISSKQHSFAVDFWSLGTVVFEFLAGVPPFNRETENETNLAILSGNCDWSLLEDASPEAVDFIKKLLVVDPTQRLGANGIQEIMNHPWFKGIDWDNVDKLPPPYVPDVKPLSTECFEERYQFETSDAIEKDIIADIEDAKKVIPRSVSMTDLSTASMSSDTDANSDDDCSYSSDVIELYSSIALQNLAKKSEKENFKKTKRRMFYQIPSNSFSIARKIGTPPIIPR